VLVALFQREGGEMEVILTTRAKHLRRHPSQTVSAVELPGSVLIRNAYSACVRLQTDKQALPGGRADDTDHSFYHTAVSFPARPLFRSDRARRHTSVSDQLTIRDEKPLKKSGCPLMIRPSYTSRRSSPSSLFFRWDRTIGIISPSRVSLLVPLVSISHRGDILGWVY
jgi:hypothetical protein